MSPDIAKFQSMWVKIKVFNFSYITAPISQFFGDLSIPDITSWLQRSTTMDYLALVKAFRNWVRSQIGK